MSRVATLIVSTALLAAACSIPIDDTAQVIDPEQLPDVLRSTTTTTTSVSPEPGSRTVVYYLIQQLPEQARKIVVAEEREVDSDSVTELLAPMFTEDFQSEQGGDLFNALSEFELLSISIDDGVATVNIGTDPEIPTAPELLKDGIAQLVWTITEFSSVDLVRILIDSEEVPLPTTRDDIGDTEAGELVDTSYFESYDPEAPAPPPPTTTTESPTTTTESTDG